MVNKDSGAEKAGEAGETEGCRGECASNIDRRHIINLDEDLPDRVWDNLIAVEICERRSLPI